MQKLDDPLPRYGNPYTHPEVWPVDRIVDLPRDFDVPGADLFEVLEARHTRRNFSAIELLDVSALLWFTQRRVGVREGHPYQSRYPIPTAGGLGSVRTIVVNQAFGNWIYLPVKHQAGILKQHDVGTARALTEARGFFDIGDGCILLFATDRAFFESYYEKPESLVLREAGVITGVLALVCEALGLSFCPLGTQAAHWIEAILGVGEELIIPGGAAVLGRW